MSKVVEDTRYRFRADFPGVMTDKVEEFDSRDGALAWRLYTSRSPDGQRGVSYTATVKVFETDTTDARQLFQAGESDATQSIGATLIGREDGAFGVDKLPSRTLTYQSGTGAGMLKGKVLLIVKDQRLYVVTFYFSGSDQTAVSTTFFQSFEILK